MGRVKRDLNKVFINLESAHDTVPRERVWQVLDKKEVFSRYIDVIRDMYSYLHKIGGEKSFLRHYRFAPKIYFKLSFFPFNYG